MKEVNVMYVEIGQRLAVNKLIFNFNSFFNSLGNNVGPQRKCWFIQGKRNNWENSHKNQQQKNQV